MNITAYDVAQRFVGLKEVAGIASDPQILAMLKLDGDWPQNDEVPWCSAFVNYVCWLLRLPRSKSLAARSWLSVGTPILAANAKAGFDVVILNRTQVAGILLPHGGPEVLDAPGHVGFFAGFHGRRVIILGGNQGNTVSIAYFDETRILGFRRLADE